MGRIVTALLLALLASLLVYPVVMLAIGAFLSGSPLHGGNHWSIAAFPHVWQEITTSGALINSTLYAVLTTVFGVALAGIIAFLSERTDCPFRTLIKPLMMVCATTSTVFYAIGYALLANRHNGALNILWRQAFGGIGSIVNIESWSGLILVDTLHVSAFLYLFIVGPLGAMDRSLEEAALMSGASRWRVLKSINLRLLTPILTSAVLIGLINGMKSFNIPLILGSHADISFVTVRILRLLQSENPPRYAEASALGLFLSLIVVMALVAQHQIVGHRSYITVAGRSFQQVRWPLGRWRLSQCVRQRERQRTGVCQRG